MPGLARRLTISAVADGLLIQPLASKGQRPSAPLKIRYGESAVSSSATGTGGVAAPDLISAAESLARPTACFEAFGIIGLVTIAKLSFLITIVRRETVAHIAGSPVYVVTEVAITPCSSQREAEDAIEKTNKQLDRSRARRAAKTTTRDDSESSDSELDDVATSTPALAEDDDVEDAIPREYDASAMTGTSPMKPSNIAENVISKRGSYGRFAQSWFSRAGWLLEHKRHMGLSDGGDPPSMSNKARSIAESEDYDAGLIYGDTPLAIPGAAPVPTMLPKLLRTLRVYFGTSRSFYFSYDYDITRRQNSISVTEVASQPLYRQVDEAYFWNRYMAQPLIDGGDESFVLPLMQGFVGQTSFVVDSCPPQKDEEAPQESVELSVLSTPASRSSSPVALAADNSQDTTTKLRPTERKLLLTLISRRSTKRAGLRYLRRGIDDEGNVANYVETEQILSSTNWDSTQPVYSFIQIRGSIPLFFTQTAYSLKPMPVLQHSEDTNYAAFTKHFDRLQKIYGQLQLVNLVEKKGIEMKIGEKYEGFVAKRSKSVASIDQLIPFEWFDFHHVCRGMKFENVSQLLEILRPQLEEYGSSVQVNGKWERRQKGILRTNCMDCLDRTNVCQSSFAKYVLEAQLRELGFDMSVQLDQQTAWFNTLWADNGDAVSNQYASTAAMKGDYTRFKKRDYRGTLNDIGLSLTRFYNGMVNDYFSQAAIDFVLGNVTSMVFDEFEANMMTKDPAISMSRMRDQAIEECQKRVVADDNEEFIGGWVLLSPHDPDTLKSEPFQEVVLLLTDSALYLCRYDWNLDKVSSFERADLSHVTSIKAGVYITSTITALHMDEQRNFGFVVTYLPGKEDFIRTNTRTPSTLGGTPIVSTDANTNVTSQPSNTSRSALDMTPPSIAALTSSAVALPSSLAELLSGKPRSQQQRLMAFKAPYTTSTPVTANDDNTSGELSEAQRTDAICAEIERLVTLHTPREAGEAPKSLIKHADVISLEEAKKSTGLFDTLGYAIKKMVWAS
ncbi:hypothetical protein Cpir12675_003807 [Ceratocystis pirilliformis]|uniref:Phosphatidylinositide phosphatase SAC2 n=1 Tax=Ceratocystis pirilliformis TaxID=259994 RepID=A0ABR3Z1M7_9PEZI